MTDVTTLLAGIKARWMTVNSPGGTTAPALADALASVPRLIQAIEAVAGLHKPVAIYELDEYGHLDWDDESKFVRNICGTCSDSTVTENLDDGNYDLAGEWGETPWPCPTITAVVAALGGGE